MNKPELVLSNTTSFFIGGVEATFKKAKKYGFKYLEVLPYRWSHPEDILRWEQKYGIQVAGIHLPVWWNKTLWQQIRRLSDPLDQIFAFVWNLYLGDAKNNPGLQLAEKLTTRRPYLLLHAHLLDDLGNQFTALAKKFNVVVENLPYHQALPRFYWNPVSLQKEIVARGGSGQLVFDIGHFNQNLKKRPEGSLAEAYRQTKPEIIHISYNSHGIHLLPTKTEREELKKLLQLHSPKYITLETNPLVSVKKGKKLFDRLLDEVYKA